MQFTYKILVKQEPEGGFAVNISALPECITYWADLNQVKVNTREALELYIESPQAHGEE